MFDSLKNFASQDLGEGGNLDPQALGEAVSQHLESIDPSQLSGHLQTAASNLQQNGQGDLAQQATALAQQLASNPGGAKDAVVSFIQNNPQVLQHFAPDFAQGILSKI